MLCLFGPGGQGRDRILAATEAQIACPDQIISQALMICVPREIPAFNAELEPLKIDGEQPVFYAWPWSGFLWLRFR
ncbi:hypothetical protein [Caulobacter sp.]|uniref:hypothetical protein n=1 Tax=Caulobacter sp. TaxID=78 RepID=UPI003BB0D08B